MTEKPPGVAMSGRELMEALSAMSPAALDHDVVVLVRGISCDHVREISEDEVDDEVDGVVFTCPTIKLISR